MGNAANWDAIRQEIERRRNAGETFEALSRLLGARTGGTLAYKIFAGVTTGKQVNADKTKRYMQALGLKYEEDGESESGEFGYVRKVTAQLGLGGSFVTDGGTKAHYAFRKDFFHEVGRPEDLVLFTAQGESMRPTICDGDMVLLNTSKELQPPKEGELWGVRVGNQLMAKRVFLRPGELILRSDNPGAGGEFSISTRTESQEDFQLMGKVRWLCRIVG